MCRYGAEGATAEAAAVQVDGELYHVIRRYAFPLILGMRQSGVRQVERVVQLRFGQGRVGGIDYYRLPAYLLQDARSGVFVALLLDVAEVGGFFLLIFQALFVREEEDVALLRSDFLFEVNHLRDVGNQLPEGFTGHNAVFLLGALFRELALQLFGKFHNRLLAHAVDDGIGSAIHQDAGAHAVLPIVVVCQPSHACLDAAQYNGGVGIEFF